MRHGETEWSRDGAHTSRTDLPLTPEGEQRAANLRRFLGGRPFALVLTSPMRRAIDTCRLAGYAEFAQITLDLREWDYGSYEGRTTADIQSENPGWTIWIGTPPSGETAEQVAGRSRD
jgi:probable phosphoglycerate mutase